MISERRLLKLQHLHLHCQGFERHEEGWMLQYENIVEHRLHVCNHTVTSITDQSIANRHHFLHIESGDVLGLWDQSWAYR